MKIGITIAVVFGIIAILGIAILGFSGTSTAASTPDNTQKTGCGSCSGNCNAQANCGLQGCAASSGKPCGCGK